MTNLKLEQDIIKELNSKDVARVNKVILKLRKKKGVAYVPIIFDLLLEETNSEIKQLFSLYIYDNKDTAAVKVLIDAISDDKYISILPVLISACWQNGLDFTEYADLFIDKYIEGTFAVAIEVFSVIEVMFDSLSQEQRNSMITKLQFAMPEMPEEKKKFTKELIIMLK